MRGVSLLLFCVGVAFAGSPNLGTVKDREGACQASPVPNTTCRRLQVTCPDLKPIDVQIRITEPSAGVARRGTVVLGSGSGGSNFYAAVPPVQDLVKQLADMGFLVVDRAWNGGWTTHEGGLKKESCRYATLLTWIHGNLHKGGKFVATGNSGGSAEIGYALTTWGRGDILDLAIPTSGPPVARLDLACVKAPSPEWAAMCSSIIPKGKMECASQCILGTGNDVCKQVTPEPTPEQLHADSVMHPDAVLDYPKTRVHFLYGAKDCGEPVPIGLTFATRVRTEKEIEFVPNTPHNITQTPEGREAVRRAIDKGTAASSAEVLDSSSQGFTVKVSLAIAAPPADVYRKLVHDVGEWWNSAHTFSGSAKNLSIDDKPMGCFCERLPNGGGVRHMEVIFAAPGKGLVMSGALGPMQPLAAAGTMRISLTPAGSGTKFEMVYSIMGYLPSGMQSWAKPAQGMLADQFTRLKNYLETGKPGAK